MSKIIFLNEPNAIYDGAFTQIGKNQVRLIFADNMPSNEVLVSGFNLINEHNGEIQTVRTDYNYIYRTYKDNALMVELCNDNIQWVEPDITVKFAAYSGGSLDGNTKQVVKNYKDLVIPTPVANENYEFVKWSPEIPTSGVIERDITFTAVFVYVEPFSEVLDMKISELSNICEQMIIDGVYIGDEHFSYTKEDQMNLKELFDTVAVTRLPIGYHADGQPCREFSANEIINIYVQQLLNKYGNETYFNQARCYLRDLKQSDKNKKYIADYTYGTELTGTYLENYNSMLDLYRNQINALLPNEQLANI